MKKQPVRRGHAVKTILFRLIAIAISVEFILQLISVGRYIYMSYSYDTQQRRLITENWYWSNPANRNALNDIYGLYMAYHPLVGWLPNPTKTETITITNNRIRVTSNNPPDNDVSVPDIYMFGGSTLWGHGVLDAKTIPSYLAQFFNTTSYAYRVINYGQIAYNSNQELAYLLLQLKTNPTPKTVVFYDGCNDLFYNLGKKTSESIFYESQIRNKLQNVTNYFREPRSVNLSVFNIDALTMIASQAPTYIKLYYYPLKIYEKIQSLFTKTKQPVPEQTVNNETFVEKTVADYINNANAIDALSRAYGFQYVLLWQPIIFSKAHLAQEELSLPTYSPLHPELMYELITKKLNEANIKNFYDMTHVFDKYPQPIFFDSCHVSPEGNRIIARDIVDILKNTYQL